MSLRARLSLVLVGVVFVALVAANVAVYAYVSNFLTQRVDEQLIAFDPPAGWARRFEQPANGATGNQATTPGGQPVAGGSQTPVPPPDPAARSRPPADIAGAFVQTRSSDGSVVRSRFLLVSTTGETRAEPELPATLVVAPGQSTLFDTVAHASDGDVPYRVRAVGLSDGSVAVTALPTSDVQATRERLVLIAAVATIAVLITVAGVTWWLVGLGLRPLERMEETAEAIAEGDLSRRVDLTDQSRSGTEVARLGNALNAMLAEIETAFSAKEASERKLRRFVSDASHELRTPLTSIRGYAELLRRDQVSDPAGVSNAARRIEQEATRMGTLVEDLLLLARLDEGAGLALERVDVQRIVTDLVTDARVVAPDRSISFEPGPPLVVRADRNRLTQVVANLLANARVHTPPGTPIEVRLSTRPALTSPSPGDGPSAGGAAAGGTAAGAACIEVVDHGEGIDPALVASVFDRFVRADSSRSRESGGAGLGLAIVAAIVDAHQGRCEVEETPGGGATFRVLVPTAGVDDRPAVPPSDRTAPLPDYVA